MPPRILPLVPALLFLGSCAAPPLVGDPWEATRAGSWGIGLRPALFTVYGIDGEFVSKNFAPPPDEIVSHDEGDIVGRFGLALEGQYFVTDRLCVALGADRRVYDIEHLTPTPELDTNVDRIVSLQYYGSLRYLLSPLGESRRWRPYGQVSLAWLPGVDVGFEVDLSDYGSSNLDIETKGKGYWVGGVSTGMLYHWRTRWVVEAGLLYEFPITTLEADLGFELGPTYLPLDAEFRPQGWVGFCGLSYYF